MEIFLFLRSAPRQLEQWGQLESRGRWDQLALRDQKGNRGLPGQLEQLEQPAMLLLKVIMVPPDQPGHLAQPGQMVKRARKAFLGPLERQESMLFRPLRVSPNRLLAVSFRYRFRAANGYRRIRLFSYHRAGTTK